MDVRSGIITGCFLFAVLGACGQGESARPEVPDEEAAQALDSDAGIPPECEGPVQASELLPGVEAHHLTLAFWLEQLGGVHDLDHVLLSPEDIEALNAGIAAPRPGYHPQRDLSAPIDLEDLAIRVEERRVWAREKLAAGEYVHADGQPFAASDLAGLDHEVSLSGAVPELRVALDTVPLRCAPMTAPFLSRSLDARLDRNACSSARPQEPIVVVRAWPDGMRLAVTRHAFGWIAADAALSPPAPAEVKDALVRGVRVQLMDAIDVEKGERGDRVSLAAGELLAAADARGQRAHVATSRGFLRTAKKHAPLLRKAHRPLTRRALLEEAWRYLNAPYGLGDTDGGRDCSRLLVDVFESFGVKMPRHSSWQARAGSFWVDVSEVTEAERLLLIDAAAKKGVVLLSFPGHIMLYLGRNERGEPMALHAFREYLEPCQGRHETLVRVGTVTVSNLELGRGTSRTAFAERITHITVLGAPPGVELGGAAELRPTGEAAIPSDRECRRARGVRMHVSPSSPSRQQSLRVLASLTRDPGPVTLTLIDPAGERVSPEMVRLGGPPYGFVATVERPRAGRWKAVLADGPRVLACQRVLVRSRPPSPAAASDGPVWRPTRSWTAAMEDYYALFVERLFDYPIDDDRVWPNLHTLLRDPERNILHNHLSLDEEAQLELVPDCADLPYTLRAYFAWKLRLPFGYRRCTRARGDRPPDCNRVEGGDSLMSRLELRGRSGTLVPRDDVDAFSAFANVHLRNGVHSSSGRTHPDDDASDYYPVPLTRQALRPGTLFADPYGHLLIIARWIPQGAGTYGILVGVDAQPDGTVGRRRFWRGSFLFDPDTTGGGAGFKAVRPRVFVDEPVDVEMERGGEVVAVLQRVGRTEELPNEELRKSRRHVRYSLQQYEGTADDFYAAMEALINPRPLDPATAQLALVDALAESVARRVTSVTNGEAFMASRDFQPIDMPEGSSIFLTSGPWEDFSTPSRDLRLLISIDSVIGFPRLVRNAPQRYGLREESVDQEVRRLEEGIAQELARRTFTYVRSDGSEATLSLADVIERSERLELAYNPNDCVEIRWGAAPGSAEMATCKRRAPEDQRARMDSYRHWFSSRKRPAR